MYFVRDDLAEKWLEDTISESNYEIRICDVHCC